MHLLHSLVLSCLFYYVLRSAYSPYPTVADPHKYFGDLGAYQHHQQQQQQQQLNSYDPYATLPFVAPGVHPATPFYHLSPGKVKKKKKSKPKATQRQLKSSSHCLFFYFSHSLSHSVLRVNWCLVVLLLLRHSHAFLSLALMAR